MVFPVAVGVGPCHTSSRPFPPGHNNNLEVEVSASNNDTPQEAVQQHNADNVVMAVGTNADETLSATMFISYHFIPILNSHDDTPTSSKDIDCNNEGNTTQADTRHDPTNDEHIEMESLLHHVNNTHASNNNQSFKTALDVHNSTNTQQFNVIAELRVQITPTTAPYVSNMDAMSSRETKSRVPLGIMRRSDSTFTSYEANPSIEFASNETHLACLIPLPSGYQLVSSSNEDDNGLSATSTIVIYRVQAQNVSYQQQLYHKKQHNLPKLPDYIVENELDSNKTDKDATENNNIQVTTKSLDQLDISSHEDQELNQDARGNSVLYVAHEPKIVRTPQQQLTNTTLEESNESQAKSKGSFLRQLSTGKSTTNNNSIQLSTLQCATCMCTVPFDHYRGKSSLAKSFLLVGTTDGSLLFIDFTMARVRSVLLKSTPDNLVEKDDCINPIIHISQCTPTQWKGLDIYGEEQGSLSKGRIATVMRDGSVNIYITSFVPSSSLIDNWVENGIEQSNSKIESRRKATGLEMRISLLSTYNESNSNLRYIRAKWINPIVLVLLTRSPYLDEAALQQQSKSKQSEMVIAQVWTVAEVVDKDDQSEAAIEQVNGWRGSSDIRCNIALISELKMPCGDSLDELVHDTFSLSLEASQPIRGDDRTTVFTNCTRCLSITYHSGTDCLAINSLAVTRETSGIKVRPFCLIWDWKRNVPGLTLASSTSYCLYPQQQIDTDDQIMAVPSLSWFQLGQDEKYGLVAVHVYITTSGKILRARKNIYSLSTLSPLSRSITEGHNLNVTEPSAILLHLDSVTFPVLSRSTNSEDMSLQWEESSVPPTYIASNGPCQMAAVGKDYGQAIAIASSRGLCVLDLSRMPRLDTKQGDVLSLQKQPRWKLFSNINDEHRFRIESMSWWECGCGEDFLLAAVQYTNIESLHLVCWSRKSLGFGSSQLLAESSSLANSDYGLALLSGFRIQSMSIMKNPDVDATSNSLSHRALLLLSYVSSQEGASGSSIKYAVYQLQTKQSSNGKIELVLARNKAYGRIPLQLGSSPDLFAVETVTSIFLAGGSFVFDLNDTGDNEGEESSHETTAVVGVTTLFQGLVAVCISPSGPTLYQPPLLEKSKIDESSSMGQRKSLIVSYWVSDTISSENGCRVAWNIAKNDGKVYCWSVPCTTMKCTLSGQNQSSQYHSPELEKHSVIGEICHLGQLSLWMNGATNSEREISLGPYRPLDFGCVLYAGQRSRKRTSSEGLASFHVTSCTLGPPQFTPFLYVSFLEVSSSSTDSGDDVINNSLSRDHIKSTLHRVKGLGSSSSALRIITFKVVQLLDAGKDGSWTTGKAILTEIVSVVKEMYDPLGFATFFLSVGRQLEPHQFNLIFPLPSDDSPPVLRTAEDLFFLACAHGSLATAVSALPLFSSHEVSQQSVVKLIYHCLIKIEENVQSYYSHTILTSGEDESYLHQLFWFGVKLEDALEIEKSYAEDDEDNQSEADKHSFGSSQSSISASSSTTNYEESSSDDDEYDEEETDQADYTFDTYSSDDDDSREVSFLTPCRSRTPKKKPRVGIVKKVVKRLFPSVNNSSVNNSKEEGAIHDAASSFILNGFDELSSAKNPNSIPNKEAFDEELLADTSLSTHVSVGGTVCLFLNHLITSDREDCSESNGVNQGWKVLSVVAHLLQGERETSAITSAASANAQRIAGMITLQDLQSLTSYDVNKEVDKDKALDRFASHLVNITSDCHQQINSQACNIVLNLILLLLLRYDTCQDVQIHKGALIAIGIVSGHLSGRIDELLGENRDTSIIYTMYTKQLNA